MLKLVRPNRRKTLRRRGFGRRSIGSFCRDSRGAVMARQLRFGGNGTLNFHIAAAAVLPPALQSKQTLVE